MPKKPKTDLKNATITLPRSIYVAARRAAAEQDKSLSRYVAELLEQHVGDRPADGLTPGQRLVAWAKKHPLRNTRPLETDKSKLMGD